MFYIKHKRGIAGVLLLMCVSLFSSVKAVDYQLLSKVRSDNPPGEIEQDYEYRSPAEGIEISFNDELEDLFNKFNFKEELRLYFRQICFLQNVDPVVAISLARIESWAGNHPEYNDRTEKRRYTTYGVDTWDLGLFQMSDFYTDYWENYFYNPGLISSLGIYSGEFDLTNDYISIQVGVAYLGHLNKRFQSYFVATLAYNTGPGRVLEGNIPEITYQYAHAIKNSWSYREGDV